MITLRIGVTGHRTIDDPVAVTREIRRASVLAKSRVARAGEPLERGRRRRPGGGDGGSRSSRPWPKAPIVSSPTCYSTNPARLLAVVLPFAQDDYLTDFVTPESKAEFLELLGRAAHVQVAPPSQSREEGYELAGRLIVHASDAMIAVWDGEPSRGRGGTAEIVDYAREMAVPVYWIATSGEGVRLTEL